MLKRIVISIFTMVVFCGIFTISTSAEETAQNNEYYFPTAVFSEDQNELPPMWIFDFAEF